MKSYPCLLFAYNIDEDPTIATATDIVELKSKEDKGRPCLRKEGHTLLLQRNAYE